jgi:hypothetical protein
VAIDGRQLAIDGHVLALGFLKVSVHHIDGVLYLQQVLVHLVLLCDERLLDADELEGATANGVDFRREKAVSFLPEEGRRNGC